MDQVFRFTTEITRFLFTDFSTIFYHNFGRSFPASGPKALHFLNDIHPLDYGSEHHVPPVQPLCLHGANKELRPVSVGAGIRHGENSWTSVLELER